MQLQPGDDLDLDEEILDVVQEPYCASCVHVEIEETEAEPFCTQWSQTTEIKPGFVFPEYTPLGFEVD